MVSKNERALERRDAEGLTPFIYAAKYNTDFRMIKLLRMYGADVEAKDKYGNNAIKLAKENNNDEKVLVRLESYGVYDE